LENPAYAAAFSSVAGRVYFAPSLSRVSVTDELFTDGTPIDYGIALEGGVFVPIPRLRAVIGASGNFTSNGLQTFDKDYSRYEPIPLGDINILSQLGTTNNKFFSGSLLAARRFGSRDQSSIGFSVEKFDSNGNLSPEISQENMSDNPSDVPGYSTSRIARRRVTLGFKHDFGTVRFGAFYRYGKNRIFASQKLLISFRADD
jgi:hypothetical protein